MQGSFPCVQCWAHTPFPCVWVPYVNQYFPLPIDCFLHQQFSSHLATVPLTLQGCGDEAGRAAAPSSKARLLQDEAICCSARPPKFSKVDFLWQCDICSHGVFVHVSAHFNLSISFFQRNLETSTNHITWLQPQGRAAAQRWARCTGTRKVPRQLQERDTSYLLHGELQCKCSPYRLVGEACMACLHVSLLVQTSIKHKEPLSTTNSLSHCSRWPLRKTSTLCSSKEFPRQRVALCSPRESHPLLSHP